jgi:phage protein D
MSEEELSETDLDTVSGGTSIDEVSKTLRTAPGIDGSPTLKPDLDVSLKGVGDTFDGSYHVKGVTSETEDGYDTELDARR